MSPIQVDSQVFYDDVNHALVTHCTKCQSAIRLRLGPIADAETARNAVRAVADQPGMCPPLIGGGFAVDAHPELSFYGFWQIKKVLALIDILDQQGILRKASPVLSPSVMAFDSVEDAFAVMGQMEREANDRIQPWQWQIQKGECLFYTPSEAPELAIYAEVLEAESGNPYLFVRAHSVAVFDEDGEIGDVHRSVVARKISREAFEAARQRGWTCEEAHG
jgi:hypothetical protein